MAAPEREATKSELPDPKEVAKTYAEVAQRASKLLSDHIQKQVKKGISAPADELGIAQAFMDMMGKLLANPYRLAQAQMNLVWDYFSLWQHSMMRFSGMTPSAPIAAPDKSDKRFKDEEWQEHFLFDFIKQSYLITARHIHDTVSGVDGLDDQTQKKVNFYTRQYIDALSPSNFAMTNPEVFRETVKSHGQNLIKGLNNLLRDVEEGDGNLRVKMTDTTAFELGKNVATTPGKVVYQTEMMQLEYADGATLYVPVSQLHLISRYAGHASDSVQLTRLGSPQWERAKQRAAQKARDTAAELLALYAQRAARTGHAFEFTAHDYDAFADALRSARDNAIKAFQAQANNDAAAAINHWGEVFGDDFPKPPASTGNPAPAVVPAAPRPVKDTPQG